MKRLLLLLLGLLLVGCGKTVPLSELVRKDGLMYERDGETPFTGVAVFTLWNGQKASEGTFKDGKLEGLQTTWHDNGQKESERTYKDGKEEGLSTAWYRNGQKSWEAMFKDDKLVSATYWDEEGNER